MRNLIVSPKSPKENREQATTMKARLVRWLQQHEPHKVDDLEALLRADAKAGNALLNVGHVSGDARD